MAASELVQRKKRRRENRPGCDSIDAGIESSVTPS
jgi:hypothetical protein